jgi:hypothetical protein
MLESLSANEKLRRNDGRFRGSALVINDAVEKARDIDNRLLTTLFGLQLNANMKWRDYEVILRADFEHLLHILNNVKEEERQELRQLRAETDSIKKAWHCFEALGQILSYAEECECGQLAEDDGLRRIPAALRRLLFIEMYLHLLRDHIDLIRGMLDRELSMTTAPIEGSEAASQVFNREMESLEKDQCLQQRVSLFNQTLEDMTKKYWEAVEEIRDGKQEERRTSFADVLRRELEQVDLILPLLEVKQPEGARKAEDSTDSKREGVPDRVFQTKKGGVPALAAAFELK